MPASKQKGSWLVKGLVDVLDGAVKGGAKGTSSAIAALSASGRDLSFKQMELAQKMVAQYYRVWEAEGGSCGCS